MPQQREKVGDWGRAKEGLHVLYFGHGISSHNRNPKTLPIALGNVLILKLIVSVPEFLFVFNFLTSNYVYVSVWV